MRVAAIMTNASVTESPSDSLRSAADTMWRQQTGSLLVMEGDQLVGIITERDVMKAVARGRDVDATPVSEIMTRDVLTVGLERRYPHLLLLAGFQHGGPVRFEILILVADNSEHGQAEIAVDVLQEFEDRLRLRSARRRRGRRCRKGRGWVRR